MSFLARLFAILIVPLLWPIELCAQTVQISDGRGGFIERGCARASEAKKLPALDALADSQVIVDYLRRQP